jgi:hypothetical protein
MHWSSLSIRRYASEDTRALCQTGLATVSPLVRPTLTRLVLTYVGNPPGKGLSRGEGRHAGKQLLMQSCELHPRALECLASLTALGSRRVPVRANNTLLLHTASLAVFR